LIASLAARGLDTRLIQRDPEWPTGRVSVELKSGQPSYVIHQHVAWEHLAPEPALLDAMRAADAVCFGTLAQRTRRTRETIHACLAAAAPRALIVYDVNLRQHWYDADTIERSARASAIIKLNDEELAVLCGLFRLPDSTPRTLAELLFGWGARMVIVTRGAQGCTIVAPTQIWDVPSEPVQVVDTVGAGDAFTAAYIVATLRGWLPERSARLANRMGGLVASHAGAMPVVAAEASRWLADSQP
jgi:fructokinase